MKKNLNGEIKKIISIIITILILASLTACGEKIDSNSTNSIITVSDQESSFTNQDNDSKRNKISEEVILVSSEDSYTIAAITKDSVLWMWGDNSYGAIGNGTTTNVLAPQKIMTDVTFVKTNGVFTAAIKKDGSLWMWGDNSSGQIGNGNTSINGAKSLQLTPTKILDDVAFVYFNSISFVFALKNDNTLWAWGSNNSGALGTGDSGYIQSTPIKILDCVKKFTCYDNNVAAILDDDSLCVWGSNEQGEIGNGEMTLANNGAYEHANQLSPLKILDNVYEVVLAQYKSAAIKNDGSLWMWGANGSGELGNGTIDKSSSTPIKVLDNVKKVQLGQYNTGAITNDGSLWMWGGNTCGNIGNGRTEAVVTPQKIAEGVIDFKIGSDYTSAIKKDGTLWLWGNNTKGLIGIDGGNSKSKIGSFTIQTVPIKVLDNVEDVLLKFEYNISLQKNGDLNVWGSGRGKISSSNSIDKNFELYKLFSNVKEVINTRYDFIIMIDNNGGLWSCGKNKHGNLGIGDNDDSLVPTKILG